MTEEQKIYVDSQEDIIEAISTLEEQENVIFDETIEIIDVSEPTVFTIGSDEAFPALGEENEQLKHSLLNDRELPDQHPIMAITGLRSELDEIKALKTVYSDVKNHADYYMWQDENPSQENREGFFVSICPTTNKIKICNLDDKTDIFGVTVNFAGFVGGQDDIVRDDKYGLVVCNGIATVRCELDVAVGDYVVPNKYGIAEKATCTIINDGGTKTDIDGKCGYLVVALDSISGVPCAEIILDISAKQLNGLDTDIQKFGARLSNAETNITSAINVANEAYYLASNLGDIGKLNADTVEKANDALEKAEQALETTYSHAEQVAAAKKTSEEAKTIAQLAATSAETARIEAVKTANDALSNVNDLIDDLEPITTWTDVNGNTGATYFVEHIDNGLATKTELETAITMTEDLKLEISKNASGIEALTSSVALYSLGEYSQAYGLTQIQAESILDVGMIYVPTQNHSETYTGSSYGQREFTKGYYYTWDGIRWVSSDAPYVAFSMEYVIGGNSIYFWVVDSEEAIEKNGIVYKPDTLHMWRDNRWVVVADLASNPSNRIANTLRYTTNSLSAEIINARGSYSGLNLRLGNFDSKIDLLTSWQGTVNNSMAAIGLTADDLGASIAQIVQSVGKDGEVNAASIVTAINDYGSAITLNANRINLNGAVTANNNVTIGVDGKITAVNADISGKITADSGYIAGWEITDHSIEKTVQKDDGTYRTTGLQVPNNGTWAIAVGATDAKSWSTAPFRVDHNGNLYATSGSIGSWGIQSDFLGNWTGAVNSTYFLSQSGKDAWVSGASGSDKTRACLLYLTGKFAVDTLGNLYSTAGYIGGWEINSDYLGYYTTSGTGSNEFFLSRNGKSVYVPVAGATINCLCNFGGKFAVNTAGKLYAEDAVIKGAITATRGTIGGFPINEAGTGLEKSVVTTESGVTVADTTIVDPGEISVSHVISIDEGYGAYDYSTLKTVLRGGLLQISVSAAEMSSGPLSFMTVSVQGVAYDIYIDPASDTLKARKRVTV